MDRRFGSSGRLGAAGADVVVDEGAILVVDFVVVVVVGLFVVVTVDVAVAGRTVRNDDDILGGGGVIRSSGLLAVVRCVVDVGSITI